MVHPRKHFHLIALALALFHASLALAQDENEAIRRQNEEVNPAIQIAQDSQSIEEMFKSAKTFKHNNAYVRERLWHLAALSECMRGPSVPIPPSSIAKQIVFATILELVEDGHENRWPKGETILNIAPNSIAQLVVRTGYPSRTDPIRRLLSAEPSIGDQNLAGRWQYLETRDLSGVVTIREWSDSPVAGFGRTPRISTQKKPESDATSQPFEEGWSYKFHLGALDDLILASKACLCAELVKQDRLRPYADAIAGTALLRASRHHSPEAFAELGRGVLQMAMSGFKKHQGYREALVGRVEGNLRGATFFSGQLSRALNMYVSSKQANNSPEALFGAAVCYFGLGRKDDGLATIEQLVVAANGKSENIRYYTKALIDATHASNAIKASSDLADSWTDINPDPDVRYEWNMELIRIFKTAGLWRPALDLVMREIRKIRIDNKGVRSDSEIGYVLLIGSTLHLNTFRSLSWQKDDKFVLQRRLDGHKREQPRHFAPYVGPEAKDPRLVGKALERYGMIGPDDDMATLFEIHSFAARFLGAEARSGEVRDDSEQRLEKCRVWVSEELAKSPSNVVPLLKLIWLEWFVSLGHVGSMTSREFRDWHYTLDVSSGRTDPTDVAALFDRESRNGLESHIEEAWNAMSQMRVFLTEHYSPKEEIAPSESQAK